MALAVGACDGDATPARRSMFDVGTLRVQDQAGLLTPVEEIGLSRTSEALEERTTDQLVVVTLPSLRGRDIADFSTDLGNRWGVGQVDKDNGVLLVVAPNERKVRIAVGSGLEGLLTDQRAADIIHEMLPLLRENRHSNAIDLGVKQIDLLLRSNTARPQYKMRTAA